MTNKFFDGVYVAPECEFAEELCDELVCQSPGGSTEPFGDDVTFTW